MLQTLQVTSDPFTLLEWNQSSRHVKCLLREVHGAAAGGQKAEQDREQRLKGYNSDTS
jgi:hypothetical protein